MLMNCILKQQISPERGLLKYNPFQCMLNTLPKPEFKIGTSPGTETMFIEAERKISIDLMDIGSGLQEET